MPHKYGIPRILIVDDNSDLHEDFKKILLVENTLQETKDRIEAIESLLFEEKSTPTDVLPYRLDFAFQGQEAYDYVKKQGQDPYSVAFVDIRMPPGWDGIETIRQIWSLDPRMQMVICTAFSDYAWDETLKKLGESDNFFILKKPFDVVEVRQLAYALTKKWQLRNELQSTLTDLENLVKERTLELENSLALVKSTLESTADGILVVDNQGAMVDYNHKFVEMWDIPEEALASNSFADVIQVVSSQLLDPVKFLSISKSNEEKLNVDQFFEATLKKSKTYEIYSTPHRVGNNVVGRVWDFRDITEKKEMQDELVKEATTDKLTGLPNRTLLYDRITQASLRANRNKAKFALLFLDLDRFKLINDSLGHSTGDLLLRAIARRLLNTVRNSDTVSRLGGDEFVVIINEIQNIEQIKPIVDKLIKTIASPVEINNYELLVSPSIGISLYPDHGKTAEELLKNADIAMYQSKDSGGNNSQVYHADMKASPLKSLTMENELRGALARGEIILHYQPLIDLETDEIIGTEALARWNHPTLGLLYPDEFIGLAEQSNLIVELGERILQLACEQNKAWQNAHFKPIKISVNVSTKQFNAPHFDETLKRVLSETQLNSEYLELEITESVIMNNTRSLEMLVAKVRDVGISLVMDDFGTGYSSLSYLTRYPFDKIKIDKSFILNLETKPGCREIILAIIAMAKGLNLKVLAEGVETKAQYDFLKQNHCNQLQGYLFGKPVPAEALEPLLTKAPTAGIKIR